jgi:hypothetical protein
MQLTTHNPGTEEHVVVPAAWTPERPKRFATLRRLLASLRIEAADRRRLRV